MPEVVLSRRYVALLGLLALVVVACVAWPRATVLRARALAALRPSGEITRLEIPAIDVDSRVIEVRQTERYSRREWQVADYAVGHHFNSGAPGEGTNIVLSGHNNIKGAVFRRLDELRKGHHITITTASGEKHRYKVSRTRIVLQDGAGEEQQRRNARLMQPTKREQLTLISCWPYKPWPPYRIIIIADPA